MLRLFVTATSVALLAAACTSATAETVGTDPAPTSTSIAITTSAPVPTTTTTEPVADPETISTLSRLGRMTWQLHDLDFMVTHVGSHNGGYVALLYDSLAHRPEYRGLAEPGVVATSSDGVVWVPLAAQPGGTEPSLPRCSPSMVIGCWYWAGPTPRAERRVPTRFWRLSGNAERGTSSRCMSPLGPSPEAASSTPGTSPMAPRCF